jgi:hypothetical protein
VRVNACLWGVGCEESVGCLLCEWAGFDTASAGPGRDAVQAGGKGICAVVCFIDAITAHAIGTTVEVGRVDGVKSAFAPIPVLHQKGQTFPDGGGSEWAYRLPSLISAFIAQGILVCPNEVAVP